MDPYYGYSGYYQHSGVPSGYDAYASRGSTPYYRSASPSGTRSRSPYRGEMKRHRDSGGDERDRYEKRYRSGRDGDDRSGRYDRRGRNDEDLRTESRRDERERYWRRDSRGEGRDYRSNVRERNSYSDDRRRSDRGDSRGGGYRRPYSQGGGGGWNGRGSSGPRESGDYSRRYSPATATPSGGPDRGGGWGATAVSEDRRYSPATATPSGGPDRGVATAASDDKSWGPAPVKTTAQPGGWGSHDQPRDGGYENRGIVKKDWTEEPARRISEVKMDRGGGWGVSSSSSDVVWGAPSAKEAQKADAQESEKISDVKKEDSLAAVTGATAEKNKPISSPVPRVVVEKEKSAGAQHKSPEVRSPMLIPTSSPKYVSIKEMKRRSSIEVAMGHRREVRAGSVEDEMQRGKKLEKEMQKWRQRTTSESSIASSRSSPTQMLGSPRIRPVPASPTRSRMPLLSAQIAVSPAGAVSSPASTHVNPAPKVQGLAPLVQTKNEVMEETTPKKEEEKTLEMEETQKKEEEKEKVQEKGEEVKEKEEEEKKEKEAEEKVKEKEEEEKLKEKEEEKVTKKEEEEKVKEKEEEEKEKVEVTEVSMAEAGKEETEEEPEIVKEIKALHASGKALSSKTVPQLKGFLNAKGVEFPAKAKKADLLALVTAQLS